MAGTHAGGVDGARACACVGGARAHALACARARVLARVCALAWGARARRRMRASGLRKRARGAVRGFERNSTEVYHNLGQLRPASAEFGRDRACVADVDLVWPEKRLMKFGPPEAAERITSLAEQCSEFEVLFRAVRGGEDQQLRGPRGVEDEQLGDATHDIPSCLPCMGPCFSSQVHRYAFKGSGASRAAGASEMRERCGASGGSCEPRPRLATSSMQPQPMGSMRDSEVLSATARMLSVRRLGVCPLEVQSVGVSASRLSRRW